MDRLTKEKRSALMRNVKGKNTLPEMIVRKLLHRIGYRFRLHRKDLPGSPDLVFSSRRKIILVHGCYWHGHGCKYGRLPKSNLEFWSPKILANQARDRRNAELLEKAGWEVAVVWQCETKNPQELERKLLAFLGPAKKTIDKPQPSPLD